MKRCPQCGAEYDDYVQYCFVDGAELLTDAPGSAASPAGAPAPVHRAPTPPPAPQASRAPSGASPSSSHASQDAGRASGLWAVLVLALLGVALLMFVGLVGALVYYNSQEKPVVTAPTPTPTPTPSPPTPHLKPTSSTQTSILRVQFESEPSGAEIWEQGQQEKLLCTTPCEVEHPDYAPPERNFVFRLEGYADLPYVMADPRQVQRVALEQNAPKVVPKRGRPESSPNDIINSR